MRILLALIIEISSLTIAHSQNREYKNLVFEGAGIRGIAYSGVIKQLEEFQIIDEIEKVGGTSAGAITALMLALGYESGEIYQIISQTEFHKFNDGKFWFFGGFHRMKKKYGWYRGDKFLKWIEQIIERKTGNSETTFKDLNDQGYKGLYVTATCLNKQKLLTFSVETYPLMKLKDAVRMSIPLYFEAVFIDNNGYVYDKQDAKKNLDLVVDGGILANYPISMFDKIVKDSLGNEIRIPNSKTIGVRIDSDDQIIKDIKLEGLAPIEIDDIKSYIEAFYVIVLENLNRNHLTVQDWERTISVSSVGISPRIKKLEESQKKTLIESGQISAIKYFQNR